MNFAAVNFLAILVSAIAYMVLGFLWYGPLFGKPWMALVGMTQEQIQQGGSNPGMYLLSFIGALVAAYALALLISAAGLGTLAGGIQLGLVAGLGFVATSFGSNYLFGGRPVKLYLIDAGYQVVSLIIGGAILGLWR